jgi:hypothetical protein
VVQNEIHRKGETKTWTTPSKTTVERVILTAKIIDVTEKSINT